MDDTYITFEANVSAEQRAAMNALMAEAEANPLPADNDFDVSIDTNTIEKINRI